MYLRGYLTQILAIILINTIHNLSGYNFEGKISSNRTSRLYNPIIQVVNFPNDPCIGSSTRSKSFKKQKKTSKLTFLA